MRLPVAGGGFMYVDSREITTITPIADRECQISFGRGGGGYTIAWPAELVRLKLLQDGREGFREMTDGADFEVWRQIDAIERELSALGAL